ncbi:MAG: aminopeptidase P N-terminal domain-containing protein, partial [Abditibacteriales bacterium]|nr:aminopeptidase P N-terminal domain-containing protein [Abditibacteriales bacterium]
MVMLLAPCHAGPRPFFTQEEFAQRRQKLFEHIADGIAILLGAETPEAYIKFRQNNTFYYFTGVAMPDCVALLDGAAKRTTLFVPDHP